MTAYINTIRDKANSEFVRTEPSFDGSVLQFNAVPVNPTIVGVVVPMVKGYARLSVPSPVDSCNPAVCGGSVSQTIKLEFNILRGDTAALASMRAEVLRCFDVAVADYQLANGIVPPTTATFDGT